MKTELLRQSGIDLEIAHHSLSLSSHLDGAGHVGFINRLPRQHRTAPSFMMFAIKGDVMSCIQVPNAHRVPLEVAIDNLAEGLQSHGEMMAQMLSAAGTYVGLAFIFPMRIMARRGRPATPTEILKSPDAKVIPAIIATHEGMPLTAHLRRGRFQPFKKHQTTVHVTGADAALHDLHMQLIRLADAPPKPRGRKLRDMYGEDE